MAFILWGLFILPNYARAAEETLDQLQRFLKSEDIFIWLKEDFGQKNTRPILSVNHLVFYRPQGLNADPIGGNEATLCDTLF